MNPLPYRFTYVIASSIETKEASVGLRTNVNHSMNFSVMVLRFWVYTAPVADWFRFSVFLSWSSLRVFFYFKASLETFKSFFPLYYTFWHSLLRLPWSFLACVHLVFHTDSLFIYWSGAHLLLLFSISPLSLFPFYMNTLMACITGSDFIAGGQYVTRSLDALWYCWALNWT